jgi:hypothetical protein
MGFGLTTRGDVIRCEYCDTGRRVLMSDILPVSNQLSHTRFHVYTAESEAGPHPRTNEWILSPQRSCCGQSANAEAYN